VKKLHKLFIIIGVVLVVMAVGYHLVVAGANTDMFRVMKYNTFQLGMSLTRAKSIFSSYGKVVETSMEEKKYGLQTSITFESKELNNLGMSDESLTLIFIEDKLWSFHYNNIGI